jgi:hypothetical protein
MTRTLRVKGERPETIASTMFYPPEYAAGGGPPFAGPTGDPQQVLDETSAAVALLFIDSSGERPERWVVMDVATGAIYAEATNPGDLADWLSAYAATLGDLYESGEL